MDWRYRNGGGGLSLVCPPVDAPTARGSSSGGGDSRSGADKIRGRGRRRTLIGVVSRGSGVLLLVPTSTRSTFGLLGGGSQVEPDAVTFAHGVEVRPKC